MKIESQKYDFWEVWRRLLWAFGVATQYQIADKLGITQQAVNTCLQRQQIPAGWLLSAAVNYSLNPMWIIWGDKYKKFLVPTDEEPEGGQNGSGT